MSKIKLKFNNDSIGICYDLQVKGDESVIFIHGLGGGKDNFNYVWGFPGYARYNILTFDLPGFGDSDKPSGFSYSMEDMAGVTRMLIQQLHLEKIYLVGHSMGGAIGLLLARQIKSSMMSFSCLEGNLISEDCTGSRETMKYSLSEFQKVGFQQLKLTLSENQDPLFLNTLSKSDPYAFYKSSESLVTWSDSGKLIEMFVKMNIPICYFYGEQNKDIPVIKKLSYIPKIEISDAGHGMMTDNPSVFYKELLRFIED
jgi:pimeloyl-ACP methyl ester carboxylesterase